MIPVDLFNCVFDLVKVILRVWIWKNLRIQLDCITLKHVLKNSTKKCVTNTPCFCHVTYCKHLAMNRLQELQ